MKKTMILPFLLPAFISNEACSADMDTPGQGETSGSTVVISVDGQEFTATMEENSSAQALLERLNHGDIEITMDDYGDMEKVGSLGFSLPRNDARTTTVPGDIILYQGNSFVIYYDTNAWTFTRLGHADGVGSREQMLALLGGKGKKTVTLKIYRNEDNKQY